MDKAFWGGGQGKFLDHVNRLPARLLGEMWGTTRPIGLDHGLHPWPPHLCGAQALFFGGELHFLDNGERGRFENIGNRENIVNHNNACYNNGIFVSSSDAEHRHASAVLQRLACKVYEGRHRTMRTPLAERRWQLDGPRMMFTGSPRPTAGAAWFAMPGHPFLPTTLCAMWDNCGVMFEEKGTLGACAHPETDNYGKLRMTADEPKIITTDNCEY